ncbi:hypothetical protein F9L07_25250 [Pimelobacter simplex]|uniref:Uncharacterized protein n=1 Tax=Nocardioides simplex TaxID=2045 RepID=A0A7J5DSL2_NOCSI|nr:hypothetical protein [Pimelobacter simplex]KAB2807979.1 hypothetical protein F9L07_25250 [Pimelobacter simplex]
MARNRFRPELRVGGYRLSGIVRWDSLKHSGDLNGDVDLSARIIFKNDWRHPALRDKAPVELMRGPACLWAGTLVEPDWDAGTIGAVGASRDADNAMALDALGNASTKPNEVIDAAINRGALSWKRIGDFGNTEVGEPGSGLTTVRSVLDAWATKNGQTWHVDSRRRLIIIPAVETSINWLVTPGSGILGASGTERVDVVFVRYTNKTTGRRDTASYPAVSPTRPVEKPKEIFDRGPLLPAEAVAIATGLWAEANAGRSGWTNGLNLSAGQVTNLGGREADLAFVRAGQGMALRSVPDPRGLSRNTSIVLGDVEFDWAAGDLQANPKGLAAQDEQSALDSVAELASRALTQAGSGGGMAPFAIATGVVNVALSAVNSAFTNITFPAGRFTVPPLVLATLQSAPSGSQKFVPRVLNATTSGASVYVYTGDTTAQTATVNVAWEAIQMTPTTAAG